MGEKQFKVHDANDRQWSGKLMVLILMVVLFVLVVLWSPTRHVLHRCTKQIVITTSSLWVQPMKRILWLARKKTYLATFAKVPVVNAFADWSARELMNCQKHLKAVEC